MAADLLANLDGDICASRSDISVQNFWADVLAAVLASLDHDFESIEVGERAQFGHFATGIRVTLEYGTVQLSSAYALNAHDAATVAELMREIAMDIELRTGSVATAAQFAQADLMTAEMAGRTRVHGYVFGAADQYCQLHPSCLPAFGAGARARNAAV